MYQGIKSPAPQVEEVPRAAWQWRGEQEGNKIAGLDASVPARARWAGVKTVSPRQESF